MVRVANLKVQVDDEESEEEEEYDEESPGNNES